MYKVDTKVMERIRFLCSTGQTSKSLMSHLALTWLTLTSFTWHWSSTARSVRLVVAFVSYSEMTESSELKGADLLDATACLYKLGTDKACHRWSFMLKRERTATSIAEFKSYLTLNHGFKEVATSFGIMKFSTKISFAIPFYRIWHREHDCCVTRNSRVFNSMRRCRRGDCQGWRGGGMRKLCFWYWVKVTPQPPQREH